MNNLLGLNVRIFVYIYIYYTPITPNFYNEWNEVLQKAEKELVNLLLIESSKVVEKTERDVEEEIRTQYQTDYDRKRLKVEEQYHVIERS